MKEATGELSTTMIAVVAIAAVLTIFTVFLLPYLRGAIDRRLHCAEAICPEACTEDYCECHWYDGVNDANEHTVKCPNTDDKPDNSGSGSGSGSGL